MPPLPLITASLFASARCPSPKVDEIASIVNCSFQNTHSNPHAKEDLQLLPLLIYAAATQTEGRHARSFVEMGAFDGINGSNTLMSEKCLNWTGTLIEANVANFGALLNSKRRAAMLNTGVCQAENGTIRVSKAGGTVAGDLSIRHPSARWESARGKAFDEVPCAPLLSILRRSGPADPCAAEHPQPLKELYESQSNCFATTFFSLDVEGAEHAVLSTLGDCLSAQKFPFDILLMEEQPGSQKYGAQRLVLQSGYVHIPELYKARSGGPNLLYVSPRLKEAAKALVFGKQLVTPALMHSRLELMFDLLSSRGS